MSIFFKHAYFAIRFSNLSCSLLRFFATVKAILHYPNYSVSSQVIVAALFVEQCCRVCMLNLKETIT